MGASSTRSAGVPAREPTSRRTNARPRGACWPLLLVWWLLTCRFSADHSRSIAKSFWRSAKLLRRRIFPFTVNMLIPLSSGQSKPSSVGLQRLEVHVARLRAMLVRCAEAPQGPNVNSSGWNPEYCRRMSHDPEGVERTAVRRCTAPSGREVFETYRPWVAPTAIDVRSLRD